jgi:hypothetical protein
MWFLQEPTPPPSHGRFSHRAAEAKLQNEPKRVVSGLLSQGAGKNFV